MPDEDDATGVPVAPSIRSPSDTIPLEDEADSEEASGGAFLPGVSWLSNRSRNVAWPAKRPAISYVISYK